MRCLSCPWLTALSLLPSLGSAVILRERDLDAALQPSYDYIVVGCGISGLVVANRLSEDEEVSVLCIEAGDADEYEEFIQVPQFVGSNVGSKYDWRLITAPQTYLDGAPRPMPQGKALGGGSILNAMCWNRGGADDFDTWQALGNPGWSWNDLLPYFIKSETYTPVYSEDIAERFSVRFDPAVHGYDGPVQVSYPKYFYNQSINFYSGLNYLGVPTQFDPNNGASAGATFIPTALHPVNQTRSDARRAYYDPYASRPNFHVITGQQVTRIMIQGISGTTSVGTPTTGDGGTSGATSTTVLGVGLFGEGSTVPPPVTNDTIGEQRSSPRQLEAARRITGVEFASNASATRQTVTALREVIVTAGSLHSAQLLQLSGIGPKELLSRYSIPLALDLPGVGHNLQDHYLVGTFYPYNNITDSPARLAQNETYNAEARAEYYSRKTGPWTAGSPNGVAFPSLPSASKLTAEIFQGADEQTADQYLLSGLDETLITGYAVQKEFLVRQLADTNNAAWEIINNNVGSLTVAIMHPFSRGVCEINSPNPFDPPTIDPRYGSNPVDLQILVEGLRFNRRVLATPPMVELQPAQFVPPFEADENALLQVIKNGIRTEYHPSSTCAMLPRELGGVVDSRLRVYGTQNLRVADAGIFPLTPAAHLQSVVYAVAEKAADLIKEDNVFAAIPSTSSSSSSIPPLSSSKNAEGASSATNEPSSSILGATTTVPLTQDTQQTISSSAPGPRSEPPSSEVDDQLRAIAQFIQWLRQALGLD